MNSVGGTEILLILIIAAIVFGPKKMANFAKNAGRFIRKMKDFATDISEGADIKEELAEIKKTADLSEIHTEFKQAADVVDINEIYRKNSDERRRVR